MYDTKQLSENATIQSFLNCYLRETGNFEEVPEYVEHPLLMGERIEKVIVSKLVLQKIELIAGLTYWSETDRHLFSFPIYYCTAGSQDLQPLDYITLTSLIVKEFLLDKSFRGAEDELIYRVILSCRSIKTYLDDRVEDAESLAQEDFEFIDAEQSLLFGHLLHPTPKSKQGLTETEDAAYSPERKGEFQLHYFAAEKSLVLQDSSRPQSAASIIFEELQNDREVDQNWLEEIRKKDEKVLIPVHPLQVKELMEKPEVQERLANGSLDYIGPVGKTFTGTSSFRSVYSKDSKYMYKFSVPVKITNSLRINQAKELARGVEVSRLLETEVGQRIKKNFPDFRILEDPAYLNLVSDTELSGFEVVIRDNPFYENSKHASLVAGLCQDHAFGAKPRLYSIIKGIAGREYRSVEEVSIEWFNRYLDLTLDPMIWLFNTYGIALEAHQQNSVIKLGGGYPETFYYRDNQGYYYSESKADKLMELLPGLNTLSDTVCADDVAEERLRYYFFFNHLFGLINGFGVSGLIEEGELIRALKERLKQHEETMPSDLLSSLLYQPVLPCKANLLTRFYDMDELVGPMESQSVYTMVKNPIAGEVEILHAL
ncbi:IucA/IucC family protein [Rossellomorea oryzaecorticis]|uniref:IucA/IucC family protein n=1 Tax=Rossellomorea oryzaecorticis TaxID=1396505 RepID=A0ABU9K9U1_9BACI